MAGGLSAGGAAAAPAGISARLADFAVRARADEIPPPVLREATRSLVNVFGTALAGCHDPALVAAGTVFAGFRADARCTVIGHARRSDALHAASLNAMAGNVFDFDDTHMPTIIHPSAPVAPALFAWAEMAPGPVSGAQLLAAFAIGMEIECRLGVALSGWHYERGWHITSTCGVFGAAVACGRLLGLDSRRMLWALGNASAQSSGLVENLGTMAKSIGVGNAASNGLLSALLARQGVEGPAAPLEGPRGVLRVMGRCEDDAVLTRDLGTHWEVLNNTYKPYPCGVVLNPVIEACLALYRDHGVRLAAVDQVSLRGHPLLRQRTDRPRPASGREAQVSAQHAVALALACGRAGLEEFSDAALARPEARALEQRLVFEDDASMPVEAAQVRVRLADGSEHSHSITAARGCVAAPLTDADLDAKLHELCRFGGSGCDSRALADALWSIAQASDAAAVMALAAGRH